MRVFRWLRHVTLDAPRQARASEITAWSNAFASLAIGCGAFALTRGWPFALAAWLVAFVLLRAALIHRHTVWIAAALGTMTVAAAGGTLAWLFAHVWEVGWLPPVAAISGAVAVAVPPAWAYARLARLRLDGDRDSLLGPEPSSGQQP